MRRPEVAVDGRARVPGASGQGAPAVEPTNGVTDAPPAPPVVQVASVTTTNRHRATRGAKRGAKRRVLRRTPANPGIR